MSPSNNISTKLGHYGVFTLQARCFLTQETEGQQITLWMQLQQQQQYLPTEVYEPAWGRTGWRRTTRAGDTSAFT